MDENFVTALGLGIMITLFCIGTIVQVLIGLKFIKNGSKTRGTVVRYKESNSVYMFRSLLKSRAPTRFRFNRIISFLSVRGEQIEAVDPELVEDNPEMLGRDVEIYYLTENPKQIVVGNPLNPTKLVLSVLMILFLMFAFNKIIYKK